ncbi:MAG: PBS lyase [Gemmatimonadetes bacterium]|nr:PBS lyase [Gemmatimonadota bacterium]
MSTSYLPPVDRLLKLGAEPARRRSWPDYRTLGLQDRHVPALIRMATDAALHAAERRDPAGWAPLHAWRALGQLRASAAAAPLMLLLQAHVGSPWENGELPAVLGMIGPPALAGATLVLFDDAQDEEVRIAMTRVITEVGLEYPERREEAAALLGKQLEDWRDQGRLLNAYLVSGLIDLQETEAAPLMEAAFAARAVDLSINGDWEDAQVDLGLLAERRTPPPGVGSRSAAPGAAAQARQRRKAEKQARRRNRKR